MSFADEDKSKFWKKHIEKIMNEENQWDHMVETDVVEGPVENVARNEIVRAIQKMKSGKATAPSEVSVETIVASDEIEVKVIINCVSVYWMVEECLMSGKLV